MNYRVSWAFLVHRQALNILIDTTSKQA